MNWYCIYTHPRRERQAEAELAQQGFTTFLPRYFDHQHVIHVLFPRYLFVAFDISIDHWQPIVHTRGVHHLISAEAESPISIRRDTIEAIRRFVQYLNDSTRHNLHPKRPTYAAGTTVRLRSSNRFGSQELTGICQWSSGRRIAVLLEIMGTSAQVVCDTDEIQPV